MATEGISLRGVRSVAARRRGRTIHGDGCTGDARPRPLGLAVMHDGLDPPAPLPLVNADGVDLTLIRWTLALSPLERLRVLQGHIDFAVKVRDARRNSAR